MGVRRTTGAPSDAQGGQARRPRPTHRGEPPGPFAPPSAPSLSHSLGPHNSGALRPLPAADSQGAHSSGAYGGGVYGGAGGYASATGGGAAGGASAGVGPRGAAGGASHPMRRAAPASPLAVPAALLPHGSAARGRLRPRSSHAPGGPQAPPALRMVRLLTCGGWCPLIGLLLIGVSSVLLSYSLLHPWPHIALGLHLPWQPQGTPHTGRTMLSTFTSYLSAPELTNLASQGWATATTGSRKVAQSASSEGGQGAGALEQGLETPAVLMRRRARRSKNGWWRGRGGWEKGILETLLSPLRSAALRIPFLRDSPLLRAPGVYQGAGEAEEVEEIAVAFGRRHTNLSSVPDRRPESVRPPPLSSLDSVDWKAEQPRVALCLIGGARDFQLTGPTLSRHLLRAYPNSDAFVLSPLDDNSHKLSLLATMVPNLVHVRIAPDVPINESALTDRLLAAIKGGPETPEAQTRQGILQQFKSVEMCASVISSFERRQGFRYAWILRTRVDGFWMGPPPPLAVLDRQGYTIPGGSDWGGLNDRLGMGPRNISLLALRRLSALNALVLRGGFEALNAERVYRAHMAYLGIRVVRYDFPFCILSRKKGMPAFPVAAALSSTAALNGAKCRPCRPSLTGAESARYVAALPELVFSGHPHGIDLCLAESHWEPNWQGLFDQQAGAQGQAVRRYLDARTFQECVRDWEDFRPLVPVWDAPPPEPLCVRERLGRFRKLGYPGGEFPVFVDAFLPPRVSNRTRCPIVYSVVTGVDYSFDWALLRKLRRHTKGRVHAFDSTPSGLQWVAEKFDNLPPESWQHHPWLIGPSDAPLKVYPLELEEHPVEYATRLPESMDRASVSPPISVEAHSLEYTMRALNHSWIDILRIGGHTSLHEDIFASWFRQKSTPPICQIIVSFHRGDKHYGSTDKKTRDELLALRALGYELAACLRKDAFYESCVFFSVNACDYDIR